MRVKRYEEKLLAAANEFYSKDKKRHPKSLRAPKLLVWLHRTFGWQVPHLNFMSFWQYVLFYSSILVPLKVLSDIFWTDKGEQMQTAQYWLWYAFYPMTAVFLIAIMFRFIAWRMGLSRWRICSPRTRACQKSSSSRRWGSRADNQQQPSHRLWPPLHGSPGQARG